MKWSGDRVSVLGPILFNLYTADITLVAARHGLQLHQYADDCQLYVSVPVDEASATVSSLWSSLRSPPALTLTVFFSAPRQNLSPLPIISFLTVFGFVLYTAYSSGLAVLYSSRFN